MNFSFQMSVKQTTKAAMEQEVELDEIQLVR